MAKPSEAIDRVRLEIGPLYPQWANLLLEVEAWAKNVESSNPLLVVNIDILKLEVKK